MVTNKNNERKIKDGKWKKKESKNEKQVATNKTLEVIRYGNLISNTLNVKT